MPYRLFGGQQFFDRKEVKDVAAYLRVVVNPYDEISLRRVINYPARGIGTRSVQKVEEYAKACGIPFTAAFTRSETIQGLPDAARAALRNLGQLFESSRQQMEQSGRLHAAARALVERIEIRRALDDSGEGGNQGAQRYQNVMHLLQWLERYEGKGPKTTKSLQDFLQRVTLNNDTDSGEEAGGVTLCTLHAAKGLEFSRVFLIGCVEGQLPHSRTTDPKASEATAADLDEERRLFYVGITRARDRLYLSASRRRMLRGKVVEVTPSRYLDDLPEDHVEAYEPPPEEILSADELGSLARQFLEQRRRKRESTV